MKPLIKWAGGKSTEIKHIKNTIPSFDRYIEPFFGGGALLFNLEPSKAIINDISKELIQFYRLLKNKKARKKFQVILNNYVKNWEKIQTYMNHFGDDFINLYNEYKDNNLQEEDFKEEIMRLFEDKIVPFNGLFSQKFCLDRDNLLKQIENNVISKLKRIKNKIDKENKFSNNEIMKNIETAFRSGFYMHFRDMMNWEKNNKIKLSKERNIANYYFIREFCYGGMFRYNSTGDFNVPYGGLAYNKKDFRKKVNYLFSNKVLKLFNNITIKNMDFEELLKNLKLNEKDFVFLDPPYDSNFSDYEESPFTKSDQQRLAKILINLNAKFILIIKETPFILDLYKNKKGIKITKFDKGYSFNIKDRNSRNVKHLIIHNLNFDFSEQSKLSNI